MCKFNEVYAHNPKEAQSYSEMYALWDRRLEAMRGQQQQQEVKENA